MLCCELAVLKGSGKIFALHSKAVAKGQRTSLVERFVATF